MTDTPAMGIAMYIVLVTFCIVPVQFSCKGYIGRGTCPPPESFLYGIAGTGLRKVPKTLKITDEPAFYFDIICHCKYLVYKVHAGFVSHLIYLLKISDLGRAHISSFCNSSGMVL